MEIEKNIQKFVLEENHPCLMAQTVVSESNFVVKKYDYMNNVESTKNILNDIGDFLGNYDFNSKKFHSFIAVFEKEKEYSEIDFETLLWKQLQLLHDIDGADWDSSVSFDPNDKKFSFSLLNNAFYIIGMHPNSSRKARQFPYACLVFNLHNQFERLREMNVYEVVRDKIRKRDKQKNGSANPMLANFGDTTEALQYSGRHIKDEWKCPFKSRFSD